MADTSKDRPALDDRQRRALREMMERGQIEKTDSVEDAMDEAREKGLMSGMAGGTNI